MIEKKMELVDCRSARAPARHMRISTFLLCRRVRSLASIFQHHALKVLSLTCMLTIDLLRAG